MRLSIYDNEKLCEIKEQFARILPYLRIEFFHHPPVKGSVFSKDNLITDAAITLGDIRHLHQPGYISFNTHQKVSTLEHHFREYCGINAQVFRKSGSSWIETTTSDDYTLCELNDMSREKEEPFQPEHTPEDIHEQS